MKIMRIAFGLFFIVYMAGCSGDPTQSGGSVTRGAAKVLESDLQITTDPSDQSQPSVAYDTDNNRYLVVWTDYRNVNLSGTDIFGKLCTGSGTEMGTTMTCDSEFLISNISGSPAPGNQSQPKVAYDIQNKKYLVVWTDSRSGSFSQIFGQYVSPEGTLLEANAAISVHNTSGTPQFLNQSDPSLLFNETTKKFNIAWLDDTDSDNVHTTTVFPSDCDNPETITYVPLQFGADTNMIRTAEINGANPLTTASNIQDYSRLVFTKTSGFIASNGSITASLETQVEETHPSIFYDKATGEYFVAWQGRTNAVEFSQSYTSEEQTGTQSVTVQPPAHNATTHDCSLGGLYTTVPSMCWLAGDKVVATFSRPPTGTPTFFLTDNTAVTGINIATSGSVVTGVLSSSSNAIVSTTNPPNTNNQSEITVRATLSAGKFCTYDVKNWTVTDKDSGQQKVKLRSSQGTTTTGTLLRDQTFGTNNSFNPAVATDPNTRRALLAWEEATDTTGKDINGILIDLTNFTPYSNQISVSNAPGDQTSPAVSYDNVNQRFLAVWEDARNQSTNITNIDIFSQFVDPQGNLSGANAIVTSTPGNQLAPALTFGDVDFRKFLVVWADGRQPGNADIFGQLLEFSLSPQLLIEDASGQEIFNSAIDFGNLNVGGSTTKGFKICNNGNSQLTINSMTTPDVPFSIITLFPATLSPGICADMTAKFAPISAGSFAGNSSNNFKTTIDSNGGQVTLYFSGIGTGTGEGGGGGGTAAGSASNSSGGCSIGRKQSGPTQVADALVMLTPLFVIIALKNLRRKKK